MSLWTSLEPASATVDPGGSTTVRLRLRNTGDVVDEYRFEVVGPLAPWAVVEPQALRLYPGTTGTVELTFAPPRTPDATAGPNPYAVRITPTEHPEATTVPEGNITVTPFTEVRAELVPATVKGRFRGRPRLAVDNLGNTKLTASVSGSDNGDQLSYDIHPSNVQIEPGRAAFVKTTLKPRQIIWFGSAEHRPYTLAVQRSGVAPLDVEGTYVQRGFLPRWLAAFLSVSMALAVAFVMLWIAYKPEVRSAATERLQEAAGSTLPPAPSPSLDAPKAAPSAGVSAPPAPAGTQQAGGAGDGAGAGGGGSEEKEAEAPERTAATAVQQLAAEDPGGRHICYRAYVAGQGWTDPVCDGETTGTAGSGTPLTAVNIAVSGTKGTSSNAFVPNPGSADDTGHYPEAWSSAADGIDNYVGSTEEDAPNMLGFGINVDGGNGNVCHSTYVHGDAWLGLICDKPGDALDLTYAGAYDNDSWIEAFSLTV
ncbi:MULTISPECIES: hydrolase [unclassified Streptomyces]|uniref:hydrolase n=1 Tax=unclassified Streptomyces TaxID=2593676 RepID=UPI0009388AF3|nr:hydrolase [Streptomyces sp. CB02400]OKK07410.1 hydrolase [Streptomyces sp. CB02400]